LSSKTQFKHGPCNGRHDSKRIEHTAEVRRPQSFGGIDDIDRHFHNRESGGDGAQNDLGLECVSSSTCAERKCFGDRVAPETTLRVAQASLRKGGKEHVRDAIAESVQGRRSVPDEVAYAQDERARIAARPEDQPRRCRRVLSVGVDRDHDIETTSRRLSQARANGLAFARVLVMADDDRPASPRPLARRIRRTVVDDDDGRIEHRTKVVHDIANGLGRVESGHEHTRGLHQPFLHCSRRWRAGESTATIAAVVRLVVEGGPHAGVARADLVRRARAMLDALQMADSELSILLTGDDQIKILNRVYRHKNRPTDVLAFAQREGALGDRAGRLLGDVVVSVPTARRQAQARGAELILELTTLLAHGLLHLIGWDHETPSKDRRMRQETNRLCAAAEAISRRPAPRGSRVQASVQVSVQVSTKRRPRSSSTRRMGS
jgi:probable rRNA maturation factor